MIFSNFWSPRGLQNRAEIAKIRKKTHKIRYSKQTRFSTPLFLDFSMFWPPKMEPKSSFFSIFFENVDFVKIVLPSRREHDFWGSEPPKNNKNEILKHTRKKGWEKRHKNRFWLPFCLPTSAPKPTKSQKIDKNCVFQTALKIRAMEQTAQSRNSPEIKPFGTPTDHPTTLPMISISLSIYLSICLIYLSIYLPNRPSIY